MQVERGTAVAGMDGPEPLAFQIGADDLGDVAVVLGDQRERVHTADPLGMTPFLSA